MDTDALQKMKSQKQFFFLPFYREVVAAYPEGVSSDVAKAKVRTLVNQRHGFDPFDQDLVGENPSNNESKPSQWASNLVSNQVLDKDSEIEVIRQSNRQVMLFPANKT